MSDQPSNQQPTQHGPLWQWPDLLDAIGADPAATETAASDSAPGVTGLAFDSRKVKPGDLFIALPGDPGPAYNVGQRSDRDGHNYVDAAIAQGAVAAMTHDGQQRAIAQLPVADTLQGLQQLARYRREQSTALRIAITGSSGKTTAKTLLAAALDAHASEGSFNNHLGVPLTLASLPCHAQFGVFEIGTNHPGEIEPLSQLVRPHVAVLLNVHSAHLENFADRDALIQEKLAISSGLMPEGAFVVEDSLSIPTSVQQDLARRGVRIFRFGESANADVQLAGLHQQGDETWARYQLGARNVAARVPGGGRHRALTLGAVLAVYLALGLPLDPACNLPNSLVPTGRGNLREAHGIRVLDDSYNANPQSMAAALANAVRLDVGPGRRFALLGDMLELGDQSRSAHEALIEHCAALDGVWLVGEAMSALATLLPADRCLGHVPTFKDSADGRALARQIAAELQPGDLLLVKGSNRMFWQHKFVDQLIAAIGPDG